jgi:hypothetical protein
MTNFLGGVVLVDPSGEPYAVGSPVDTPIGIGALGSVVLIDPATGEPYKIGD